MTLTGFTVAVDGPAASGKGTLSKRIADHFGFAYLDTGLLYRAVGYETLKGVDAVEAAERLDLSQIDGEALRTAEIAQAASRAAAISDVRQALLDQQRAFAQRSGGAVLDGRDIGTVICPDAAAKLFITASEQVRATRRLADLLEKGAETDFETVLADLKVRDLRDSTRADAPLKPAQDAFMLDTSELSIDDVTEKAIEYIQSKIDARSKTA